MIRKHSLIVTMVIAAWIAVLGFTAVARAEHDDPPSASRIAFAKQVSGAKVESLAGPCGHFAPSCEAAKLNALVTSFLQ